MTIQEARKWFTRLNQSRKVEALALLAQELTVIARDTYVAGTADVLEPQRLRKFNEAQHAVTNVLIQLLRDSLNDDYPWVTLSERLTPSEFDYVCNRLAKLVS